MLLLLARLTIDLLSVPASSLLSASDRVMLSSPYVTRGWFAFVLASYTLLSLWLLCYTHILSQKCRTGYPLAQPIATSGYA